MSKNSSSRNLAGPRRFPGRLHFAVLLALTAAVVFAGYRFYLAQKTVVELDLRQQLMEVADLKVNQVVAWRLERVGDALSQSPNPPDARGSAGAGLLGEY